MKHSGERPEDLDMMVGQRSERGTGSNSMSVKLVEGVLVVFAAVLVWAIPTNSARDFARILFALSLGVLVVLSIAEYRIRRRWSIR